MPGLQGRRWFNPTLPQTLQIAVFLLYFNADGEAVVTLPNDEYAESWQVVIDTGGSADDDGVLAAGDKLTLPHRSMMVLREHREPEVEPDHSVAASVAQAQKK